MLCIYGNLVETSSTDFAIGSKRKEKLKNLLKCAKFSSCVILDSEVFTYLKNKKWLILEANKKFKIFDF